MTAAQGAAQFFVENPSIDTVLATSDGNVWLPAQANRAELHAAENSLAAPSTITRAASTAAIATATLAKIGRDAYLAAYEAVEATIDPPTLSVPATHTEANDALATALGIADLTNLATDYTVDGTTITTATMVIATWAGSGMDVATWAAQSQATREAAVTAAFPDFIT